MQVEHGPERQIEVPDQVPFGAHVCATPVQSDWVAAAFRGDAGVNTIGALDAPDPGCAAPAAAGRLNNSSSPKTTDSDRTTTPRTRPDLPIGTAFAAVADDLGFGHNEVAAASAPVDLPSTQDVS
jgi:hypothetical protein